MRVHVAPFQFIIYFCAAILSIHILFNLNYRQLPLIKDFTILMAKNWPLTITIQSTRFNSYFFLQIFARIIRSRLSAWAGHWKPFGWTGLQIRRILRLLALLQLFQKLTEIVIVILISTSGRRRIPKINWSLIHGITNTQFMHFKCIITCIQKLLLNFQILRIYRI